MGRGAFNLGAEGYELICTAILFLACGHDSRLLNELGALETFGDGPFDVFIADVLSFDR